MCIQFSVVKPIKVAQSGTAKCELRAMCDYQPRPLSEMIFNSMQFCGDLSSKNNPEEEQNLAGHTSHSRVEPETAVDEASRLQKHSPLPV